MRKMVVPVTKGGKQRRRALGGMKDRMTVSQQHTSCVPNMRPKASLNVLPSDCRHQGFQHRQQQRCVPVTLDLLAEKGKNKARRKTTVKPMCGKAHLNVEVSDIWLVSLSRLR